MHKIPTCIKTVIAGLILLPMQGIRAQNVLSLIGNNVFAGNGAGIQNTTGSSNVFVGSNTGVSNTGGTANLFLGQLAGFSNSVGNYNTFIGNSSGEANSVGSNNNFIGNGAGLSNTEGNFNVFIGSASGARNRQGGSNVHIGGFAGRENIDGSANTFIGHNSGVPAGATLNNVTVLGANALATASNSVILGNNANVGIGNSAPRNKLEITQGTANNSGLRFTNLTGASPASLLNQTKFLTVNAQGDVVLGSINGSGRLAADAEGAWQVVNSNLQNTNSGGVIIGAGINTTPAGYRLYVADGILTEKVKVAIKSTDDWADKVFSPTYRLASLATVEQFIKQHQHLPGISSADEVVREGIDVARMNAKLLEKVEELTLYSIQLEKTNQQQQAINRQQQQEITEIKAMLIKLLKKPTRQRK
ncbi:bZIP transcription factor [Spirosoma knui]